MSAAVYRTGAFLFSIACYGGFLLVFLYLLAFLSNLQATPVADAFPAIRTWVSRSGRSWARHGFAGIRGTVDLALDSALRPATFRNGAAEFKRAWTRAVPKELERSCYVLSASVVLALLMWQWRPIPTPVLWHASADWSIALGWSVMGFGVVVLLWATFLIEPF